MSDMDYYTVSNATYFAGTVALLNSLRLTGNEGTLHVLDQGLTDRQRALLAPHADVLPTNPAMDANPNLLKPYPSQLQARGTLMIIDSDMVVTSDLGSIASEARAGRICAVPDRALARSFPSWREEFRLAGTPRSQPYVNAGLVALDADRWPGLLARWWDLCALVPPDRTLLHSTLTSDPLLYADQDALNALLSTEVPRDALASIDKERVPACVEEMREVVVTDPRTLSCAYRGRSTILLHYAGSGKAWEPVTWRRVRDAYMRLMPRLLLAPDVPLRVARTDLPYWLRAGAAPEAVARGFDVANRAARLGLRLLPARSRAAVTRLVKIGAPARS